MCGDPVEASVCPAADGTRSVPATLPERLERVVDLIEIAGRLAASTAVVPGGHRVEDLRLVESARDHGIVDRIVLVGDRERISAAVDEVGIDIPADDIVAAGDDEGIAAATVDLIRAGGAGLVLKGGISTPIMNRHMLPLAVRPTVSLATVFDAAPIARGRPMVMTDAGVTTVCSFGRLVDLVRNAVDVARTVLGIERPRVAILSANEKQIPSLPSTWIGRRMAERRWPDAVVCGPLSFDLATDPESVAVKGLPDLPGAEEVAGTADVLVCPGIDAANILYKTISALNKYGQASLASITVGFPVPYVILSRSDALETRLVSIALCAVYARRSAAERTAKARAEAQPEAPERVESAGGTSPAREAEAAARRAARSIGLPLEDVNLVVAVLGHEAATVTALRGGETTDEDVVPFEQSASAPDQTDEHLTGRVAKAIGGAFVAAGCDVEAIVLCGAPVRHKAISNALRRRVGRLAPVIVFEEPLEKRTPAGGGASRA